MRPMTRKTIREFVDALSGEQALARRQFRVWLKIIEKNLWSNFNEVRETFPSADLVGATRSTSLRRPGHPY